MKPGELLRVDRLALAAASIADAFGRVGELGASAPGLASVAEREGRDLGRAVRAFVAGEVRDPATLAEAVARWERRLKEVQACAPRARKDG